MSKPLHLSQQHQSTTNRHQKMAQTTIPTSLPAKIPELFLRETTAGFFRTPPLLLSPEPKKTISAKPSRCILRATLPSQKYIYPDPIPEFPVSETKKFRGELKKRLWKEKETFGDEIDAVVNVCAEIFSEFMHKAYGGPGTLLVEPFTDMMIALLEKKLPGAPLAAQEALLWAQNYVDRDWELWTSVKPN